MGYQQEKCVQQKYIQPLAKVHLEGQFHIQAAGALIVYGYVNVTIIYPLITITALMTSFQIKLNQNGFFLGCGLKMEWRQFGKGAQSINGQRQGKATVRADSEETQPSQWKVEALGKPLFLDKPRTNMFELFKVLCLKISTFQRNSHYRIEGRPPLISLHKAKLQFRPQHQLYSCFFLSLIIAISTISPPLLFPPTPPPPKPQAPALQLSIFQCLWWNLLQG